MTAPAGPRRLTTPWLVSALGVTISLALAGWQSRTNAELHQRRFDRLAADAVLDLKQRLRTYEFGLRGARGAVLAAGIERLDRERFRIYSSSRDNRREFPGVRGVAVVRRVPAPRVADFVEHARRVGQPSFAIHELAPNAGERFLVQFVEPETENRDALGLDYASDSLRRRAALQSVEHGVATMTAPITLVMPGGQSSLGVLLFLPIFRPDAPIGTATDRNAAAEGWTVARIRIDDVLDQLFPGEREFEFRLRDSALSWDEESYRSPGWPGWPGWPGGATARLVRTLTIPVYGRLWELELGTTPAFLASFNDTSPLLVGALGLLLTVLLTGLVRVDERATRSDRQAQSEQARRASIVDSSVDAIIGESLDGVVTDWNRGAVALFGLTESEAIGYPLADLLPADQGGDRAERFNAILRGEVVTAHESSWRLADGAERDVSLVRSPILDATGRHLGYSTTVRDISDAKRSERSILELNASLEAKVGERTGLLELAHRDLRTVIDAVPSMIGYWDATLANRMANRAYAEGFGLSPEQVRGRRLPDLLGPELFEENRLHVEEVLRGRPQRFERELPISDGSGRRHSQAHFIPDVVDGEVRGFYVMVFDVSEVTESRLQLAAAMHENDSLMRTLRDHQIVSVTDRRGRILDVSDAFCRISGFAREDLIGQDHRIVNSWTMPQGFWTDVWRTIGNGAPWHGVVCNRAKDGSLYWVDSVIAPLFDERGHVDRYLSIRTDVTPLKRLEEQLRASETLLDRAGEVAGVGGWSVDLLSGKVNWSRQTRRIHEVDGDYQPTLETAVAFYDPPSREAIERAILLAAQTGESWDLELRLNTARGTRLWVRAAGTADFEDGVAVRLVGALQDITARKEAEATLAYERHLFKSLLDTVPDQIYFKDLDGRFLRINACLAQRYGLSDPAEAVGKTDADFFTAAHAATTLAVEQEIVRTERPVQNFEEIEHWPDRPPSWNLTTKLPLRDRDGQVVGTFGISRDITARKEIERQLQQSNDRFEIATSSAAIGVWELDIVGGQLSCDDRMRAAYGVERTPDDDDLATWMARVDSGDRERVELALREAMAGGAPFDAEFAVQHPSDGVRYQRATARLTRDDDGRPSKIIGVSIDVTNRRRAELETMATSSLLNSVLGSATEVAIIATDPSLTITVFNNGAERLLGYQSEELVGRATPLLIHDADELTARADELSRALERPVMGSAVFTEASTLRQPREWTYMRKDGSRVTVSLIVTAMHDHEGRLFGYLGIAYDVSRQKEAERSLREAMLQATQASAAKSQFLANMSHEIRTPLNAVIGLSYLLGHTDLSDDQASMLSRINLASKSLLAVINDILDLSKIEAGEMVIESAPFNLRHLLRDVSELMVVQAESRGIGYALDVAADVPDVVIGDSTRVNQILTNLLSNAVKFTATGGVQLHARMLGETNGRVQVQFEVRDTGIGIPPDVQARLFSPFAQADDSTTRRFGGTGLGLSIVKRLANLMGGDVGIVSTPRTGSEFHVHVTMRRGSVEMLERLNSRDSVTDGFRLLGLRILVVDDSQVNLEVARRILQREGAHVALAIDGLQAVERVTTQPNDFDIVLMDIQMPVLDGLDATRRIREAPGLAALPIIALTAGALVSERERSTEAGMNAFVTKPFNPAELIQVIQRFVTPATEGSPGASPRERAAEDRMRDDTATGNGTPAATQDSEHSSSPSPDNRDAVPPTTHADVAAAGSVRVVTEDDWPVIRGIDMAIARAAVGDDLSLFRMLLDALLGEYPSVEIRDDAPNAAALEPYSRRVHKLRGSAGTLGLTDVHRLAAETEAACRGGQVTEAALLARSLDAELRAVRECVAGISSTDVATSDNSTPPRTSRPPVSSALDLAPLLQALQRQDIATVDQFEAVTDQLRGRLGDAAFAQLRAQIESLKFAQAAKVLASLT
ncbi:MAG: PAS domain S-box protein [Gemmatimonadota bacterium]